MQENILKELIEKNIESCEAMITGDGSHFQAVIISPSFAGLSTLKRQQAVYRVINHLISEGAIHAFTMKTYSPEEWTNEKQ